jgi:hypothetical protein
LLFTPNIPNAKRHAVGVPDLMQKKIISFAGMMGMWHIMPADMPPMPPM